MTGSLLAMGLPLYASDAFGYPLAMALATVVGLGFGFVLERAGFGRATVLAAQFYGRNNRVLKVMFSAIATATAGLGLLGGLGLVELGAISTPGTWLVASAGGGLLLGVGFVISGYCPGTALVATGSGHVDAVVSLLGIMAGGVAFALAWPAMEGLYLAADQGTVTIHGALGVPWGAVAFFVVLMAVGAFAGAEWMERYFARKDGAAAPDASPADLRLRNRALGAVGVVGLLALLVGAPPAPAPAASPSARAIAARDLAAQLVDEPSSVWLVDLRDPALCAAKPIPGALCVPEGEGLGFLGTLPPTRTLVLYGAGHTAVPREAASFRGSVALLDGGYAAFQALVLTPPAVPTEATAEKLAAYETASALHSYYTGSTAPAAAPPRPKAVKRAVKKGGGC